MKKTIIRSFAFIFIVILTFSISSCGIIKKPFPLITDTDTGSTEPESTAVETSDVTTAEEETTDDISGYESNPDYLTYKAANEKLNSLDSLKFYADTSQTITMKYNGKTEKTVTETIIPVSVVGRISGDCKCSMQITARVTANGQEQSTETLVWADGEKKYVKSGSAEKCTVTDRNDKSVELYNEMTSVDNLFWDELSADYFAYTEGTVDNDGGITIKAVPSDHRMSTSVAEVEEALRSTFALMGATDIKTGEKSMEQEFLIDGEGYLLCSETRIKIEMEMVLGGSKVKVSSETMTGLSCRQGWWEPVYVEIPEE